jgi:hypothetical protein
VDNSKQHFWSDCRFFYSLTEGVASINCEDLGKWSRPYRAPIMVRSQCLTVGDVCRPWPHIHSTILSVSESYLWMLQLQKWIQNLSKSSRDRKGHNSPKPVGGNRNLLHPLLNNLWPFLCKSFFAIYKLHVISHSPLFYPCRIIT